MSYISDEFLRREAAKIGSLNESRQLFSNRSEKSTNTYFDIFLSHSFLDRDIITAIYNILSQKGLNVYVDWITDPQLDREHVTKESAEIIRSRMNHSKSLVYAISMSAEMSKWMPWELGYIDGHTTDKCAILPVAKGYNTVFNRSEYLKLYPIIDKDDFSNDIIVNYGFDKYNISNWIRR